MRVKVEREGSALLFPANLFLPTEDLKKAVRPDVLRFLRYTRYFYPGNCITSEHMLERHHYPH